MRKRLWIAATLVPLIAGLALTAGPASAGDSVSGVVFFEGQLVEEVQIPIGPPESPVFLKGFDFSGLATIEIGGQVVLAQADAGGDFGLAADTAPGLPASSTAGAAIGEVFLRIPLPTVADLTFDCGTLGTGLNGFDGVCLVYGSSPSQGSITGTVGKKDGSPLEVGDPLQFLITFDLKCGSKDYPCPPTDQEPA